MRDWLSEVGRFDSHQAKVEPVFFRGWEVEEYLPQRNILKNILVSEILMDSSA